MDIVAASTALCSVLVALSTTVVGQSLSKTLYSNVGLVSGFDRINCGPGHVLRIWNESESETDIPAFVVAEINGHRCVGPEEWPRSCAGDPHCAVAQEYFLNKRIDLSFSTNPERVLASISSIFCVQNEYCLLSQAFVFAVIAPPIQYNELCPRLEPQCLLTLLNNVVQPHFGP